MTKKHLLMLPGMMCDDRLFQHQINALSDQFEICVPNISNHDSMQKLAANIIDTGPDRFALLGLSMGGIIAMEMASTAPERISSLILLDTNPMAELPSVRKGRELQMEKVRNGKLREVMINEMKPRYLYHGSSTPEILELCIEMALDLGPEAFVNQSVALQSRRDQCETLKAAKIPSLVMCGEHDTLCTPERHRLMHNLLPNCELQIIPKSGHLPTLEQPKATTSAVRNFLG